VSSHFKLGTCHLFFFLDNSTKNEIILGDQKFLSDIMKDNVPLNRLVHVFWTFFSLFLCAHIIKLCIADTLNIQSCRSLYMYICWLVVYCLKSFSDTEASALLKEGKRQAYARRKWPWRRRGCLSSNNSRDIVVSSE
jgi:hypothetical protein